LRCQRRKVSGLTFTRAPRQCKEPAESRHDPARGVFSTPGPHLPLLIQGELFAEKQVLGDQLSASSECQYAQESEIEEDPEGSPQEMPRGHSEGWRDQQPQEIHGVTMLHGLLARIRQLIDFVGNSTRTEFLRTTRDSVCLGADAA
jgi:hypothetical protein